jgi:hypothetical protein
MVDRAFSEWDKHSMTTLLQSTSRLLDHDQQVRGGDDCMELRDNISLILDLSIIPTPSGVCLIV